MLTRRWFGGGEKADLHRRAGRPCCKGPLPHCGFAAPFPIALAQTMDRSDHVCFVRTTAHRPRQDWRVLRSELQGPAFHIHRLNRTEGEDQQLFKVCRKGSRLAPSRVVEKSHHQESRHPEGTEKSSARVSPIEWCSLGPSPWGWPGSRRAGDEPTFQPCMHNQSGPFFQKETILRSGIRQAEGPRWCRSGQGHTGHHYGCMQNR